MNPPPRQYETFFSCYGADDNKKMLYWINFGGYFLEECRIYEKLI